jgi:acetyl esterase/lipase
LALTLDVHRPARPNGAGLISIVSGGFQSSVEMAQIFTQAYPPLMEKGFTVFAVRHGSWPRYPLSSIVADMRRSVRFIRQHAEEYDVDPNRIGVFGSSAGGHLALLLGTTGDSGDPSAADPVLREANRVAAVSPGSAPSLIVHGAADTAVPIDQGETMYAALTKAGVPASLIRINGAEHGFAGAAPADLERAYAALMQWFEQHLGSAAK